MKRLLPIVLVLAGITAASHVCGYIGTHNLAIVSLLFSHAAHQMKLTK